MWSFYHTFQAVFVKKRAKGNFKSIILLLLLLSGNVQPDPGPGPLQNIPRVTSTIQP